MPWRRPNVEQRMNPLLELVPLNSEGRWLEVGSGGGLFGDLLSLRIPNLEVLKSDIRLKKNLNLLARLEGLGIRKNSLNGILAAQVLHYIKDLRRTIVEFSKKLVTGGNLLIIEYDFQKSYSWIPYPFRIDRIEEIVDNINSLQIQGVKHMRDGNRPKYSVLITKV